MFPLNTILAWNIKIIMNKKYDNNNIIIASRAYFLHSLPRIPFSSVVLPPPALDPSFSYFPRTPSPVIETILL
jgi:hypothetical protein